MTTSKPRRDRSTNKILYYIAGAVTLTIIITISIVLIIKFSKDSNSPEKPKTQNIPTKTTSNDVIRSSIDEYNIMSPYNLSNDYDIDERKAFTKAYIESHKKYSSTLPTSGSFSDEVSRFKVQLGACKRLHFLFKLNLYLTDEASFTDERIQEIEKLKSGDLNSFLYALFKYAFTYKGLAFIKSIPILIHAHLYEQPKVIIGVSADHIVSLALLYKVNIETAELMNKEFSSLKSKVIINRTLFLIHFVFNRIKDLVEKAYLSKSLFETWWGKEGNKRDMLLAGTFDELIMGMPIFAIFVYAQDTAEKHKELEFFKKIESVNEHKFIIEEAVAYLFKVCELAEEIADAESKGIGKEEIEKKVDKFLEMLLGLKNEFLSLAYLLKDKLE
eukprot:GAHX01000320.1.p1 GENE.GAHX01000320.1~~GAHX01000320.1.p1  ORF type:complete len:387 (-),score=80.76 GAHX01000320.1:37-1197(-)